MSCFVSLHTNIYIHRCEVQCASSPHSQHLEAIITSAGIAPYDDAASHGGKSAKSPAKHWVSPGYVDYSKKYNKEPPTASSRRSYIPQQQQQQYD